MTGNARRAATRRRVTVFAFVSAIAMLGGPVSAQAQPSPSPAAPSLAAPSQAASGTTASGSSSAAQRVSFGIQAATPTRPDSRTILSYNVTPGVTINDYVAVSNIGAQPLHLAVYGTDAGNGPDGKVVFAPVTQKSTQAGAWVSVGTGQIDVPGRTTSSGPGVVILPIRIAIPANATPGDHVGAVIASLETAAHDGSGVPVQLDQRIAERIYIRVSGPLTPQLAVQNLKVTYHQSLGSLDSGSVTVSYVVKNTGNAILGATQRVSLSGWFGSSAQAAALPVVPPLLPGNSVEQKVSIPDVAPRIRLTATVTLTATAVVTSQVDPGLKPFVARAGVWALPWMVLGLLLVGLLGGASAVVWWRRRVRSGGGDSDPDGPGRLSGPTGPVAPDDSAADPSDGARKPLISGVSACAALLGALLVGGVLTPAASAYGDTVPYTDARVTGAIGLCDASNHPLHGGSTTSAPFVFRAVGATAAPPQYAGTGRTATLYAYQPRPGVPAGEWSGELLTASANYSNPAHPMAQSTGADDALNAFLTGYPPQLDGLVQLRLYLGAPETPLYQKHYDATDIRISGSTWSVVRGGDQDCTSGTATSFESSVLPSAELTAPPPVASIGPAASTPAPAAPPASGSVAASLTDAPAAAAVVTAAATSTAVGLSARSTHASAGSGRAWWSVVAVLLLVLVVGGLLARRRVVAASNHPSFSSNTTTEGSKE